MIQGEVRQREIANPPRRGELVAAQIVHDLSHGNLAFDSQPESEVNLSARYKTSRGALRDALHLLSLQGIASIKHGATGGVVFHTPDPHYMATMLSIALSIKSMPLSMVMEARLFIEPLIAEIAAKRSTEEDRERLRAALCDMDLCIKRIAENEFATRQDLIRSHNKLHQVIGGMTHNYILEIMEQQISRIIDQHSVYVKRSVQELELVAEQHHQLVSAIAEHRGKDAARIVGEELQAQRDRVNRTFPHALEEPVQWMINIGPS